jgi:hypothetical protein
MEPKECPMCGTEMRLRSREQSDHVPGTRELKKRPVKEWICPECDYFEEADES